MFPDGLLQVFLGGQTAVSQVNGENELGCSSKSRAL